MTLTGRMPRMGVDAAFVASCCLWIALWPSLASSQANTLKIVVPFPAGGSVDVLARLAADHIGKSTSRNILVENRPGASTIIANEMVARAPADGNTLLMVANSFIIASQLRSVSYDPLSSFEPICHLVDSPQVIVIHAASPYRTLAEFVSAARAKPGAFNIATNGPATLQHVAAEMFKKAAQIDLAYIPYSGSGPAANALLGGHVTSVLANYADLAPNISSGKLRALATTSPKRIEPLPDLPTVSELGLKFEATAWFGVVAPAGTPASVVSQLTTGFAGALSDAQIRAKLTGQQLYPVGTCGADFRSFLRNELEISGRTVKEAQIKGE